MRNVNDIVDLSSEAGVLASIAIKPELVFYSEALTSHHFSSEQNGYLYYAISELAKKDINQIDSYNISNILQAREITKSKAETLLPLSTITEFLEIAPTIARHSVEEYKFLVKNVLDAAFRRNAYIKLQECENFCFDNNIDDIGKQIYSTLDNVVMEFSNNTDIPQYKDIVDDIWARIKMRKNGKTKAIDFPFPLLNEYVVMEPGECVCFVGPMKSGKSAVLLTCAVDLLKKDKSVLYVDTEISDDLFSIRLLSHLTKIPFGKIRSGNFSQEEEEIMDAAVEWLKTRKFIHTYAPTVDSNSLYLTAKKSRYTINPDVVILDYLRASDTSNEAYSTYVSLGNLTQTLKNSIGSMGIATLTAAQTTGNGGKIADSARIARTVSTVVSIEDKPEEEIEEDGTGAPKKLRVLYNRNGAQMLESEWIDMDFDGSTLTYSQAPKQHAVATPY